MLLAIQNSFQFISHLLSTPHLNSLSVSASQVPYATPLTLACLCKYISQPNFKKKVDFN